MFILFNILAFVYAGILFPKDVQQQIPQKSLNFTPTTFFTELDSSQLHPDLINMTIISGYLHPRSLSEGSCLSFVFYGTQSPMGMYQRPTIIWLDGGPGQSSMLGNLLGVGPLVWDEDELKLNEFSWNRENNLLVVDQPVDTGYSYASTTDDIPKDLNSVAVSFYEAMDEFFTYKVFTPLKKQHWFMVGSDYAGKYIPYIVKHFHEQHSSIQFNGIALGNPFTSPPRIMSEIANFAYNRGLIDFQERQSNERTILNGQIDCINERWDEAHNNYNILINDIEVQSEMNRNNIVSPKNYDTLIYKIKSRLNISKTPLGFYEDINFKMASRAVYESLYNDFMNNDAVAVLEALLPQEKGCSIRSVRVLIYQGQNDLTIPNPGVMQWVYDIKYKYTNEFQQRDFQPWVRKNVIVGYEEE